MKLLNKQNCVFFSVHFMHLIGNIKKEYLRFASFDIILFTEVFSTGKPDRNIK